MELQDSLPLNGLAKLAKERRDADLGQAPADPEFERKYPTLFSLLTNNRVDEGKMVDMPSLRIQNNAGDWCFALSVTGLHMYGEQLYASIEAGFKGVDQALAGGTFPWKVRLNKSPRIRDVVKPK